MRWARRFPRRAISCVHSGRPCRTIGDEGDHPFGGATAAPPNCFWGPGGDRPPEDRMAQVGVICPVDGATVSNQECRACARSTSPRAGALCAFSPEMIVGMTDGGARRATAHSSTTMLTGGMRQTKLGMQTDDHVEPNRVFPAFRGQWGHLVTRENPVPGTVYEIRVEPPVALADGRTVAFTGQGDALDVVLACSRDVETEGERTRDRPTGKRVYTPLPTAVDDDDVFQLNAYRLLVTFGSPQ